MRTPTDIQPPDEITPQVSALIEQRREYKLITPLFGGGVVAGEVDLLTPIRGSEIRGQLRFWWRATRGGQFNGDLAAMKRREDAIWGKAAKKEKEPDAKITDEEKAIKSDKSEQKVLVEVTITNAGESKKPFDVRRNRNGNLVPDPVGVPGYAAFSLRPTNDDLRQKTPAQIQQDMNGVQHNVRFLLKLLYAPVYHDDIQAALWAWETFGGIGARTRRGFGALQLLQVGNENNENLPLSNQAPEVIHWLQENLQQFVTPAGIWPEDVPHLAQTLVFAPACPATQALYSWDKLINQYKSFRQARSKGETGRSNWPEAEAIRELTGRRYYKYRRLNHPEKFPRAAFGLPILFHFKDERDGDPHDTTLQGAKKENERLASPLILRPLLCRDGSAIGLAALLQGSRLPPMILKEKDAPVKAQLSKGDLSILSDLNAEKLKGETDILQAFLNTLGGR
jgi:CRISPR-associated protein Cmr1